MTPCLWRQRRPRSLAFDLLGHGGAPLGLEVRVARLGADRAGQRRPKRSRGDQHLAEVNHLLPDLRAARNRPRWVERTLRLARSLGDVHEARAGVLHLHLAVLAEELGDRLACRDDGRLLHHALHGPPVALHGDGRAAVSEGHGVVAAQHGDGIAEPFHLDGEAVCSANVEFAVRAAVAVGVEKSGVRARGAQRGDAERAFGGEQAELF